MPIQAGQPIKASEVVAEFATKENSSNKVTSLSSTSTNAQYPSAKVVYDQLATKENSSNKVTSLSSTSTNAQYPSASTVYTALDGKQAKIAAGTANNIVAYSGTAGTVNSLTRVTSVRVAASALDTALPTEKAVRSAIDAIPVVDISGKADTSALDSLRGELKLLIGNFNYVINAYECGGTQGHHGQGVKTWYAAVQYAWGKTPLNLRGPFTSSLADEYCIDYQRYAVGVRGAYRLLTDAEWMDAHRMGKITDKNSGAWEWCGDLSSYFGGDGYYYQLRRVIRMPSTPAQLNANEATNAHAFRLARTV